ncbi:MAG: hypothetical protein HS103_00565 [Anaerolineales bacterium]|nr:hypothetical protein [Anaerolineales bacterium]
MIYLVATLTDPKAREQANLRILKEQFDPGDIQDLYARQQLVKALEYKRIIDEFVGKQSSAMRVALMTLPAKSTTGSRASTALPRASIPWVESDH